MRADFDWLKRTHARSRPPESRVKRYFVQSPTFLLRSPRPCVILTLNAPFASARAGAGPQDEERCASESRPARQLRLQHARPRVAVRLPTRDHTGPRSSLTRRPRHRRRQRPRRTHAPPAARLIGPHPLASGRRGGAEDGSCHKHDQIGLDDLAARQLGLPIPTIILCEESEQTTLRAAVSVVNTNERRRRVRCRRFGQAACASVAPWPRSE